MNTPSLTRRVVYGTAALLAAACASALTSGAAWAHGYGYGHYGYGRYGYGPRVGFGVVIGAPYWGYYPPPPYYYPYYPPQYYPPVVGPPSPPVYVEKGEPSAAPPPQAQAPQVPQVPVWYFCPGESGYYPYVRQCPGGWQTVPAQPPPPPPAR